jgi:hypothetical protein
MLWCMYALIPPLQRPQSHLGRLNRYYASLLRDSLLLGTLACSRFPQPLLTVGFVVLLIVLSLVLTILVASLSHSVGFSSRCKNMQLISLLTRLSTSTPFEMEDPSSIRYRRPASFSRKMASTSPPGQYLVVFPMRSFFLRSEVVVQVFSV